MCIHNNICVAKASSAAGHFRARLPPAPGSEQKRPGKGVGVRRLWYYYYYNYHYLLIIMIIRSSVMFIIINNSISISSTII